MFLKGTNSTLRVFEKVVRLFQESRLSGREVGSVVLLFQSFIMVVILFVDQVSVAPAKACGSSKFLRYQIRKML